MVGGGWWVGFAKSFSCQTQPLCCVEVRVRVGVLTIQLFVLHKRKYIITIDFLCGIKLSFLCLSGHLSTSII